jgi:hypothetical protein
MKKLLPLAFPTLLLSTAALVLAYPKPNPHKISWELDIEQGTPTRIVVQEPGAAAPRAYWYLPFTVTNNTKEDQLFLPVFELVDEKGNVSRSDKDIPKAVFEAIKAREGKKLMEPLAVVSGALRVGVDEAKDSVAIWPEPTDRMGTFTIFVTGLSGEAVWWKDGKETPMREADWTKVKPEQAGEILRKTLSLEYQVPGDEFYQGRDRVVLKRKDWVMR